MENDIVKGIAKALRDTFGPGYRIYQNDIEQGFQTPCFSFSRCRPHFPRWAKTASC